eukprot:6179982-Pleurochrysis_carterae.AAC.4
MSEGQPLVLRLGHTAPDFMLSLNLNGLLCPALFDPMTFKAGKSAYSAVECKADLPAHVCASVLWEGWEHQSEWLE